MGKAILTVGLLVAAIGPFLVIIGTLISKVGVAIPLFGGVVPYSLMLGSQRSEKPGILAQCLYNSGLATLTAGSIFQGILEIYGTTSHLSIVYWTVGLSLSTFGLIMYAAAANPISKRNDQTDSN